MGMNGRQRKPTWEESVIPQYLAFFEEGDIDAYWKFLFARYHLSEKWRERYYRELADTPKSLDTLEFFFQFLIRHINPILTALRYTHGDDKIVFKIAKYLIQDRINERIKESNYERNYYFEGLRNASKKGRI